MEPFRPADWFYQLFGFNEDPSKMNERVECKRDRDNNYILTSKINHLSYNAGNFQVRYISSFLKDPKKCPVRNGGTFNILCGNGRGTTKFAMIDAFSMQSLPDNDGATYLAASNFNCLEFVSSMQTAYSGVTNYVYDMTQGPYTALACPQSAVLRNYFIEFEDEKGKHVGQLSSQINLLSKTPLRVDNGYVIIGRIELGILENSGFKWSDENMYGIGVHSNCDVLLTRCGHNFVNLSKSYRNSSQKVDTPKSGMKGAPPPGYPTGKERIGEEASKKSNKPIRTLSQPIQKSNPIVEDAVNQDKNKAKIDRTQSHAAGQEKREQPVFGQDKNSKYKAAPLQQNQGAPKYKCDEVTVGQDRYSKHKDSQPPLPQNQDKRTYGASGEKYAKCNRDEVTFVQDRYSKYQSPQGQLQQQQLSQDKRAYGASGEKYAKYNREAPFGQDKNSNYRSPQGQLQQQQSQDKRAYDFEGEFGNRDTKSKPSRTQSNTTDRANYGAGEFPSAIQDKSSAKPSRTQSHATDTRRNYNEPQSNINNNNNNDSQAGTASHHQATRLNKANHVYAASFNFNGDVIEKESTLKIASAMLKAEYKATIYAAWENSVQMEKENRAGARKLFLTLLGGGVFGNPLEIIAEAIKDCKDVIVKSGLKVYVVCFDRYAYNGIKRVLDPLVKETGGEFIQVK